MKYLIQFQINIFSLLILLALYIFTRQSKIKTFSKYIFHLMVASSSVAIIMEPLTWMFDSEHFFGAFFLEYSTNFVLFIMAPVVAGFFISYVDFRIFQSPKRIYRRFYYQHVSILTLLILIVNAVKPLYFKINPETNGYNPGDFIWVHYMILGLMYVYMFYFIIKNLKKVAKSDAIIFMLFFFVPILGMIIQLFEVKIHLAWTSTVLVLLVVYIFMETTPSEEDYLTKLYNRRSFEQYLNFLTQKHIRFCLIMFDLNDFKSINDIYGHYKGDEVLVAFASIIKEVFGDIGVSSRIGGDEFAVAVEIDIKDVDPYIELIKTAIAEENDPVINKTVVSYGYDQYDNQMTLDQLFKNADQKMYAYKRTSKSLND